jgi:monofunctional biosynthetic peptidoglycan transglycosylase
VRARRWRRRLGRLAAGVAAGLLLGSALPVAVMRWVPPLTSSFMLQREIRARLAGDAHFALHYHWVPLRRISPEMAIAAVAAEDQKFPTHWGFDWASIGDALAEGAEGEARPRGASTITQQVAKNLFLWPGHSWVRKGLEAWIVGWLELLWPKRRILEVHLNLAEFGPGVFGVEAASERFFGKPAARIGRTEAALLAAVLPNPARLHADAPSAFVRERATWIEAQMRRLGPAYLAGL